MANTTFIKQTIEPHVRDWLSDRFEGHQFAEQLVKLASGMNYAFDAVSEDGSIVAAILSNRPKTRSGNENTGGVRKALTEIAWLNAVPEPVARFMVFTDPGFRELVARRAKRLGVIRIEFIDCPLPKNLQQQLVATLDSASLEQKASND